MELTKYIEIEAPNACRGEKGEAVGHLQPIWGYGEQTYQILHAKYWISTNCRRLIWSAPDGLQIQSRRVRTIPKSRQLPQRLKLKGFFMWNVACGRISVNGTADCQRTKLTLAANLHARVGRRLSRRTTRDHIFSRSSWHTLTLHFKPNSRASKAVQFGHRLMNTSLQVGPPHRSTTSEVPSQSLRVWVDDR